MYELNQRVFCVSDGYGVVTDVTEDYVTITYSFPSATKTYYKNDERAYGHTKEIVGVNTEEKEEL